VLGACGCAMSQRTIVALGMASAVTLVFCAASCRQIAGIPDQPAINAADDAGAEAGAEAGASCAVSLGTSACDLCSASSCCAESMACAGAPGCNDLAQCLRACGVDDGGTQTSACIAKCVAQTDGGVAKEALDLRACQATRCAAACGVACGGYAYSSATCATCSQAPDHCCAVESACTSDPECAALLACELPCGGDASCLQACELARPGAVSKARTFTSCTSSSCPGACVAQQWLCLEKTTTKPFGGNVDVTYAFTALGKQMPNGFPVPLVGLQLRLCNAATLATCNLVTGPNVVNSAITDANGEATMTFPVGFFGYAEITGGDYGPILAYIPPPSSDVALPTLPLPTHTDLGFIESMVTGHDHQPGKGSMLIVPKACDRGLAPGVSLSIMPKGGAVPFYFAGQLESSTATETDKGPFSAGGFFAVTPGAIILDATVVESNLPFHSMAVGVRADGETLVIDYADPP
jgi:hypothetical protein